jgi:hypothetical protein
MGNLALDRIKQQINSPPVASTHVEASPQVVEKPRPNPISSEELRKIFMPEEQAPVVAPSEDKKFDGIEEFVAWYLPVRDKFSDPQNVALSTLVQTRDFINSGCGCKRQQRLNQANEYYKSFWSQNTATDLPQKVCEVGGFKSVLFCVQQNYILQFSTQ